MSKQVYVYTMSNDGRALERTGIISRKTENSVIVTVYGGQHIICARKPDEIHNNAMWSKSPHLRTYAEKMLEILVERKATYQDRIDATNRRIIQIRKYAG